MTHNTLDYPVIDVDVHIHETTPDLVEFADGTLRRTLELDRSVENYLDTPGLSPLTAYDPPLSDDPQRNARVARDTGELRSVLDELGVDAAIVYTGRLLGTAIRHDPAFAVDITQTYNRYLQARWLRPDEGIYGAILVAAQDAKASAREIERCAAEPGFAAVMLPMASVYPLWGHADYEPIYAAAEAAGLPLVLQGYTHVFPVFPYQMQQFDTALAKQVLARPFGVMANFVNFVTTGALARHPKLKVVLAECGFSWLLPMLWRLDSQHQWLREETPFYSGDAKPSDVMQQIYVTTHRLEEPKNPQTLAALFSELNLAEHMLFATDWPRYDADVEGVERVLNLPVPTEAKRKILSDNARAIFKLPQVTRRAKLTT